MNRSALILVACGLLACGDDDSTSVDGGGTDATTAIDSGADASTGCARDPAPADRARKIVIAHPFVDGGGQGVAYEVLDLSTSGDITIPGVTFEMGRANGGEIVFTPDGEVGLVVQGDGTVGVFRFDAGAPVVVHAGFDADGTDGFWATVVAMAADGAHAYILNGQWRNNGGGIYRVAIECDGSLSFEGLLAASKLPWGMELGAGDQRALIAARDILASAPGDDAFLLDWTGSPTLVDGVDAFGDDEAFVASTALTADGDYFLIGDNNAFYSDNTLENRVAVVAVQAGQLTATQVLSPIEDPIAIVTSPDDDAALVVSGFGDAIFALDYQPVNALPFAVVGELAYVGNRPQLPGSAVMIERGALRGRVFVAENLGVRQVSFGVGGVTDLGVTIVGAGSGSIVGAIGVQP